MEFYGTLVALQRGEKRGIGPSTGCRRTSGHAADGKSNMRLGLPGSQLPRDFFLLRLAGAISPTLGLAVLPELRSTPDR
jgi:hypothetical protein